MLSGSGQLPLLDRRGGCALWKMTRSFQTRADGVVVQETSPEQPPRRAIFRCPTPHFQEGAIRLLSELHNPFTASMTDHSPSVVLRTA